MKPDQQDLDQLTKKELKTLIQKLRIQNTPTKKLTKKQIIHQLIQIPELQLNQNDLMNVEQEYNIGFKKTGWLKIYRYISDTTQKEKNRDTN